MERFYEHKVAMASAIIPEVAAVSGTHGNLPINVTVGDCDGDVTEHNACPAEVDWRVIFGDKLMWRHWRIMRVGGKVV